MRNMDVVQSCWSYPIAIEQSEEINSSSEIYLWLLKNLAVDFILFPRTDMVEDLLYTSNIFQGPTHSVSTIYRSTDLDKIIL